MTQAADNYVESLSYETNRSETKQNRWNKSNTVSTDKIGQNVTSANTVIWGYCNMNGTELSTVAEDRMVTYQ